MLYIQLASLATRTDDYDDSFQTDQTCIETAIRDKVQVVATFAENENESF